MRRYILIAAMSILGLMLLSCGGITTATITLTYTIDEINSTDEVVHMRTIDLTEEPDYNDHRDNIESVDQIAIVAWIYNDGDSAVSATLYADTIDTYTTEADVRNHSNLIYEPTFEVPPDDSVLVDWANGIAYMQHGDYLEDLILNRGIITIYLLGEGEPPYAVRVYGEVVITLTVRL